MQQQPNSFISPQLASLLTAHSTTVTQELAKDTSQPVHKVAERLFGKHKSSHVPYDSENGSEERKGGLKKLLNKLKLNHGDDGEQSGVGEKEHPSEQRSTIRRLTPEELQEVAKYGKWGSDQPSELFLNIYAQTLLTLEDNPLNGLVSPCLAGSSGVVSLSIISVIPDIIEHHADIIVRAEKEIFLATNFWEASGGAKIIVDAMKELSRRVISNNRTKVVMKLMYDRGTPSQMISPHQTVDAKIYTGDKVKLPHPDEIPGIHLEVQNYHKPPVGTFHAKYMVVDRKVAILNSNNIQDRVNVEMMLHLEGPIVQSLYDVALISWSNAFDVPLPLIDRPPTYVDPLTAGAFDWGDEHPAAQAKGNLDEKADHSRTILQDHHAQVELRGDEENDGKKNDELAKDHWDADNASEVARVNSGVSTEADINKHLNTGTAIAATDNTPPPNAEAFKPVILMPRHDPVPMAMVSRPPHGRPGHGSTWVPQDQAWLAGFKMAEARVFIQTPTFNAVPVVEAALETVRRGVLVEIYMDLGFNDEGELLPYQGGTNEMVAAKMYNSLTDAEKPKLRIYWYTGKDQKTPLNAKDKSRNCHVKLMIIDSSVIIQGNGNQDTQSWFHSQEVNVMIDSAMLSEKIREQIDSNQNTLYYGLVDPRDGVWRDKVGNTLPGQRPPPSGPFKSLVGVKGAIQRVRGEGGF